MPNERRPLCGIAQEVRYYWPRPYFGAKPYLDAMLMINSTDPNAPYIAEDARTQVIYFLANAATWRGPEAKRLKAELKAWANIR